MVSDRLRVGIVGVGWGVHVQVPAFRAVPEFEVVALCARTEASVDKAGGRTGITDLSTDWHTFVRRDDLDVISIATPTVAHHDQVLAAIEAGKHVLCEKPLALTDDDARDMLARAEDKSVAHAVCFEDRWSPEKYAARELISGGYLGTPYSARVSARVDYWHPAHPLQSEWMYRSADGGGYLLGLGAHDLDYLCWLFGEPAAVCADVRTTVPTRQRPDGSLLEIDADDTASVLIRFESGVVATHTLTAMGLHAGASYHLDITGSAGAVAIDGTLFERTLLAGTADEPALSTTPGSSRIPRSGALSFEGGARNGAARQLALLLEDWLPAFDGKPTPDVPGLADGLRVQRIITAARRSSAGAGWVEL
ncbi:MULTISPECIES: Gfo/Idh/MocA family protein [Nocardia]|uniref:Gfo/Idh/MocA family protein n=1 Tax=Nocardia elegans TaxID=300029 RepID=A0ABW6TH89_9NOCA|nr:MULTISPECIES: Gfo/Idh/MocA family oxidoreductase [Nocardia]